jgi:predicted MFS family arabinose efflux permease
MVGFSETYFSAYALFLGANNFQIGLLTSVPPFLAGLSQFGTIHLERKIPSRRNIVCFGVLVQLLTLIPLFLAYYFEALRLEVYITLACVYSASNAAIGPIWNSWMGDLVTTAQRGIYFGRRNRYVTIGTFASMTVAGFLLRYFKNHSLELVGFAALFGLAFFARAISLYYLSRKYDAPRKEPSAHPQGMVKFLRELSKKNYGMLILYMSMLNFAVFVSAAYFTPLMIREYHFDYLTYTVVISATALTKFMTFRFWGELCDKLGARRILNICGSLMAFNMIPWLVTKNPIWLFSSQAFTGFVWAGYDLSTFIFLLDATEPRERTQVSSYLNIMVACSGLLGGLVGAGIFELHPHMMHSLGMNIHGISSSIVSTDVVMNSHILNSYINSSSVLGPLIYIAGSFLTNPFFIVIALSGFLRIFALMLFGQKLREVRVIAPVKASEVFLKATGFKSAIGFTTRLVLAPVAKNETTATSDADSKTDEKEETKEFPTIVDAGK